MGGGQRNIMRHPEGASTLLLRLWVTSLPDEGPLLCSPGVAGRLTVIISALGSLSSMPFSVLVACGSRLGGRGVKGDS